MPLPKYLVVSEYLDFGFLDPLNSIFLQTNSLILLIGLPGSGKSTLARELQAIAPNYALVSTDAIRQQLFGDESIQGSWELIWKEAQRQFQQAICLRETADLHLQTHPDRLQTPQEQVRTVIYDATNVVRCDRRQVLAALRSIGFRRITGLWLDTPLELCLKRNQSRNRQVPEAVIQRMHRRLMGAPPSLAEGLDCLIRYRQDEETIEPAVGKIF